MIYYALQYFYLSSILKIVDLIFRAKFFASILCKILMKILWCKYFYLFCKKFELMIFWQQFRQYFFQSPRYLYPPKLLLKNYIFYAFQYFHSVNIFKLQFLAKFWKFLQNFQYSISWAKILAKLRVKLSAIFCSFPELFISLPQ